MAWETRPGGKYYYRGERRGGRVVKRYFGNGMAARMAADLDAEARRRRADEAAEVRLLRDRLGPADAALAALDDACHLALEATLTAAGFRRHNYAWRRRRARPD